MLPTLSGIIPINSSTVAGPGVLLGATEILRFLNVSIMAVKLCWQALSCGGSSDGGSIIRKSSKI